MLECKICGKKVVDLYHLVMHLTRAQKSHNVNNQQYYDLYILRDISEKKCKYRQCGNETKFSSLKHGYNKYCSSACCNREKPFSPEWREKNSLSQIIAQNRSDVKERSRESARDQWKDPSIRKRTIETLAKTNQKPETKERQSKTSKSNFENPNYRVKYMLGRVKMWNNLEFKQRFIESHNSDIARKNHSDASKKKWLDPIFRSKMKLSSSSNERKNHMSDLVTNKMLNGIWQPEPGFYKHGYFESRKNNEKMFYRSSTELSAYEILEADKQVLSFEREPYRIPYIDKDGNSKFCIPDILVTHVDNHKELIEVKPDIFVNDKNIQCKIKAMREYCIVNSVNFRLWLESEIIKQKRELAK